MVSEREEVKNSIYAGMSIFNDIKNSIVKIGEENVSFEDKKYIGLYLGVINSENKISSKYNEIFSNMNIEYELLEMGSYIELYIEYFVKIFRNIDFNSMEDYFEYLLNKDIIKKLNIDSGLNIDSNKKLIKK